MNAADVRAALELEAAGRGLLHDPVPSGARIQQVTSLASNAFLDSSGIDPFWRRVNLRNGKNGIVNCTRCVVAVDRTVAGLRTYADGLSFWEKEHSGTANHLWVADALGYPTHLWRSYFTVADVADEMRNWGHGGKGILRYPTSASGDEGHVLNAVNIGGEPYLIDGQDARTRRLIADAHFDLLYTGRWMPAILH